MPILGISTGPHDAGACLLDSGGVRSQILHSEPRIREEIAPFPGLMIERCLREGGCGIGDLDLVVFADSPSVQLRDLFVRGLSRAPLDGRQFVSRASSWLASRLWSVRRLFADPRFIGRITHAGRHRALAAALVSEGAFTETAYLVFDSGAAGLATGCGRSEWGRIIPLAEQHYPHSLEYFTSSMYRWLGLPDTEVERFAGLAATGSPVFAGELEATLMDLMDDGSFYLNMDFFFCMRGLRVDEHSLNRRLGLTLGQQVEDVSCRADCAASILRVQERIIGRTLRFLHCRTDQRQLCVGGNRRFLSVDLEEQARAAGFSEARVGVIDCEASRGAALYGRLLEQGREVANATERGIA